MSVRDRINELFRPYRHDPDYRIAMTRFRGLMRTYQNLEDTMKNKPPKRRKRAVHPSPDPANPEGTNP